MDNEEDNNDEEDAGDDGFFIETKDEEMDSDKKRNYDEKVKEIQQVYLPTLYTLLSKVSEEDDDQAASCHKKLQALYTMFITPRKKLTLESLLRCERLLKGLTKKIKFQTLKRKTPTSPGSGKRTRPTNEPVPSTSQRFNEAQPSTSGLCNLKSLFKNNDMANKNPGSGQKGSSKPRRSLFFPFTSPDEMKYFQIPLESLYDDKKKKKSLVGSSDSPVKSNKPKSKKSVSSTTSKPEAALTNEKSAASTSSGSGIETNKDAFKKPKHKPIPFIEDKEPGKIKKNPKHTPIVFNNDEEYGMTARTKPTRFDVCDPQYLELTPKSYGFDQEYSSGPRRGSWSGFTSTSPSYVPSYSPIMSTQVRHTNPNATTTSFDNHRFTPNQHSNSFPDLRMKLNIQRGLSREEPEIENTFEIKKHISRNANLQLEESRSTFVEKYSNPPKPTGLDIRKVEVDHQSQEPRRVFVEKYCNPPRPSDLETTLPGRDERISTNSPNAFQQTNIFVNITNEHVHNPAEDMIQSFTSDQFGGFDTFKNENRDTVSLRESEKKLNKLLQQRLTSMKLTTGANSLMAAHSNEDSRVPNVTSSVSHNIQSQKVHTATESTVDVRSSYENALEEMMSNVYERSLDPRKRRVDHSLETKLPTCKKEVNKETKCNDDINYQYSRNDDTLLLENNCIEDRAESSQSVDTISDNEYSDPEGGDDKLLEVCRKNVLKVGANQNVPTTSAEEKCILKKDKKNTNLCNLPFFTDRNTKLPLLFEDSELPVKSSEATLSEQTNSYSQETKTAESEEALYDSIVKFSSRKIQSGNKILISQNVDADSKKSPQKESLTKTPSSIFIKDLDKSKHAPGNHKQLDDKSSQSLRSKLSDQIQTIHKVGTPTGGSLRGLKQTIKQDKMMPPGRIASLKPGTLFDLVSDKPQRPTVKQKVNRPSQNASPQTTVNALNIIKQIPENDLKKLISEHLGKLSIPLNTQSMNSSIPPGMNHNSNLMNPSMSNHTIPQFKNNSAENNNLQSQNMMSSVNSNFTNWAGSETPEASDSFWHSSTFNNSYRVNAKDPRTLAQNISQQYTSNDVYEKPSYSRNANEPLNNNEVLVKGSSINSIYAPPDIHIDPLRSPCYDGSSTPNLYNVDNQAIQQMNTSDDASNSQNVMPSFLRNPQQNDANVNGHRDFLREPEPNNFQRPSHLGTPSMYNDMSAVQKQSPMSPYGMHQDVHYQNYPGHQIRQTYPRYPSSYSNTYRAWKAEQHKDKRNPHFDVQHATISNYNCSQSTEVNKDTVTRHDLTKQGVPKHFDPLSKISMRDPRRKSIEENMKKKEKVSIESNVSTDTFKSSSPDISSRVSSPSRDRNRSRYYERGSDYRSNHSEQFSKYKKMQSTYRDSPKSKRDRDSSSSPNKVDSNPTSQKNSGSSGLQSFRIPKIKRETDKNTKVNVSDICITKSTCKGEKVGKGSPTSKKGIKEDKFNRRKDSVKTEKTNTAVSDECSSNEVAADKYDETRPPLLKTKDVGIETTEVLTSINKDLSETEQIQSQCRRSTRLNKSEGKGDLSSSEKNEHLPAQKPQIEDNEEPTLIRDSLDEKKSSEGINTETTLKTDILKQDSFTRIEEVELETKRNSSGLDSAMQLNVNPCSIVEESSTAPSNDRDSKKQSTCELGKNLSFATCGLPSNNSELNLPINPALSEGKDKEIVAGDVLKIDAVLKEPDNEEKQDNYVTDCAIDLSIKHKSGAYLMPNQIETVNELPHEGHSPRIFNHSSKGNCNEGENGLDISEDNSIKEHKETQPINKNLITPQLLQHLLGGIVSLDKLQKVADILAADDNPSSHDNKAFEEKEKQDVPSCSIEEKMDKVENVTDHKTINNVECINNTLESKTNTNDHVEETFKANDSLRDVKGKFLKKKVMRKRKKSKGKPKIVKVVEASLNKEKKPKPKKNELDRLQDDISKYHDSEAIAAASGLRLCRLKKEQPAAQPAPAKKKPSEQNLRERLSSLENESDSDSSGAESLFKLSEKLKSKYGPLVPDDETEVSLKQEITREDDKKCCNVDYKVCVQCKMTNINPQICNTKAKTLLANQENQDNHSLTNLDSHPRSIEKDNITSVGTPHVGMPQLDNLKPDSTAQSEKCTLTISHNLNEVEISSKPICEMTSENGISVTDNKESSEDTGVSKSKPGRKSLSRSILSKYGLKKRKNNWQYGVIKKSKSKKRSSKNLALHDKSVTKDNLVDENISNQPECNLVPVDVTELDILPETDTINIEEGCFEFSDPSLDHSEILSDISNSFKQKCDASVVSIVGVNNKNQNQDAFEKLSEKLVAGQEIDEISTRSSSDEETVNGEHGYDSDEPFESDYDHINFEALPISQSSPKGKSWWHYEIDSGSESSDGLTENDNSGDEQTVNDNVGVEDLPISQCLPEETRQAVESCHDDEFDSEPEEASSFFTELFNGIDNSDSDDIDSDLMPERDLEALKSHNTHVHMLFENQVDRCKTVLDNQQSLIPPCKMYETSLPEGSNFSEFTYIMKQLDNLEIKLAEQKSVQVGGLQAFPTENDVFFLCSVKIFNNSCEFQTNSLEKLGQHVNEMHHYSKWDGTCQECFVFFTQNLSCHDKAAIYTQSRAFCHLVRKHVPFVVKQNIEAAAYTSNEDSTEEVSPPRPYIRVRRLSGDKLSTPFSNSEISVFEPETPTNSLSSTTPSNPPARSRSNSTDLVIPVDVQRNFARESRLSKFKSPTFWATLKTVFNYESMLAPTKLRHLFKCGGYYCAFTTDSVVNFTDHLEEHKRTRDDQFRNPNENWKMCVYCMDVYDSISQLCHHVKLTHETAKYQCSNCFYRAVSINNLNVHHAYEHRELPFTPLGCKEIHIEPPQDPAFSNFVFPLRCIKEGCSIITYIYDTFFNHMINVHGSDVQCHLCFIAIPSVKLLMEHYKDVHDIGVYQCLFCTYGANAEATMKLHLCYKHPDRIPKAFHRATSIQLQDQGNREVLKKVVFHCEEKLLKFVIPHPDEPNKPPLKRIHARVVGQNNSPSKVLILNRAGSATISYIPNNTNTVMPKIVSVQGNVTNLGFPLTKNSSSSAQLFTMSGNNQVQPSTSADSSIPKILSVHGNCSINSNVALPNEYIPSLSHITKPSTTATKFVPISVPATVGSTGLSVGSVSVSTADCSSSSSSLERGATTPQPPRPPDYVVENYFKCGNTGCDFDANTSMQLRNHLTICDYARVSERLTCVYCKRHFKQVNSLVEHQRIHGPPRFSCSLCEFKAPVMPRIIAHMKSSHQVCSPIVLPINPLKKDNEKDLFIASPKEKKVVTNDKPTAKGKAKVPEKTKFSAEEEELIPQTALFAYPLGCSLCIYETKVRSNLIRHVHQHTTGGSVSQVDVINPVPQKSEKMFDKMMNLALSSHKKKTGQMGEEESSMECQYKYVPPSLRFKCRMDGCSYQCLSDTMLRDHISVIHKDEIYYKCPHCPPDERIPVDQLGLHLKLHDCPLFKCGYCQFYSHIKRAIEKHQDEAHFQEPVLVQSVRITIPAEIAQPLPPTFVQPEEQGEIWFMCLLCNFRTKKKKMMLTHGVKIHRKTKSYSCSVCSYEHNTNVAMVYHINRDHLGEDNVQINCFYRSVYEKKKPTVMGSIPPLWKRDAKKTKLIRGICLDEKGDAPPPVATCVDMDVTNLDILELKLGKFGKPEVGNLFVCPRCPTFKSRSQQEMREHLYRDLEYKPVECQICRIAGTQRAKISKHVNRVHNIDLDKVSTFLALNINEDIEAWVAKVLSTQSELMKDLPPAEYVTTGGRKRRRSSMDDRESVKVAKTSTTCTVTSGTYELMKDQPAAEEAPTVTKQTHSSIEVRNETKYTMTKASAVIPNVTKPPNNDSAPISDQPSSSDELTDHESPKKRKKGNISPFKRRFACNYCKVSTKYISSLKKHSLKAHPGFPVKFTNLSKETIDSNSVAYLCCYCNCTALSLKDLKNHWADAHKESKVKFMHRETNFHLDADYECCWCKKRSDIRSLFEHWRSDHPNQTLLVTVRTVSKYKCSECSLVFNSVDILKRHFSMDHSSKHFSYVVVEKPKALSSGSIQGQGNSSKKSKEKSTYKCFNCHRVSSMYWVMVKHMERHFYTYKCMVCEGLFNTPYDIRVHMTTNHPKSKLKPKVLKGTDREIENAKKNIVIVYNFGKDKRKITEEELIRAEKEDKISEQSLEMYSYDEPLEPKFTLPIRETARKSTSPTKKLTKQIPHPKKQISLKGPFMKSAGTKRRRKNLSNVFVNLTSQGKKIKLPAEKLLKLVNLDAKVFLEDDLQNA